MYEKRKVAFRHFLSAGFTHVNLRVTEPRTGRLPAEQIHSKFAALTLVSALNMEHSGYFDSPSQTHTRPIFASSTLSEVGLASMKSV